MLNRVIILKLKWSAIIFYLIKYIVCHFYILFIRQHQTKVPFYKHFKEIEVFLISNVLFPEVIFFNKKTQNCHKNIPHIERTILSVLILFKGYVHKPEKWIILFQINHSLPMVCDYLSYHTICHNIPHS